MHKIAVAGNKHGRQVSATVDGDIRMPESLYRIPRMGTADLAQQGGIGDDTFTDQQCSGLEAQFFLAAGCLHPLKPVAAFRAKILNTSVNRYFSFQRGDLHVGDHLDALEQEAKSS